MLCRNIDTELHMRATARATDSDVLMPPPPESFPPDALADSEAWQIRREREKKKKTGEECSFDWKINLCMAEQGRAMCS